MSHTPRTAEERELFDVILLLVWGWFGLLLILALASWCRPRFVFGRRWNNGGQKHPDREYLFFTLGRRRVCRVPFTWKDPKK